MTGKVKITIENLRGYGGVITVSTLATDDRRVLAAVSLEPGASQEFFVHRSQDLQITEANRKESS